MALESKGLVDPLSNLNGAPVFIHAGGQDGIMPSTNQLAQKALVELFGANTKYVLTENAGHNRVNPAQAITHVYGNLANSGINVSDQLRSEDSAWETNGQLSTFDQTPFIQSAVAEHAQVGGSADVDH